MADEFLVGCRFEMSFEEARPTKRNTSFTWEVVAPAPFPMSVNLSTSFRFAVRLSPWNRGYCSVRRSEEPFKSASDLIAPVRIPRPSGE